MLPYKTQTCVFPAPLAGVTDLSYRKILRDCGVKLMTTEMISAGGILYKNEKTWRMLKDAQIPGVETVVQLFGRTPADLEKSAAALGDLPFSVIDINMGCPVRKITSNGEGSALMKTPELAGDIVRAVKRAQERPVTVKMRIGWDRDSLNAVEFARVIEDAGADLICVHGRTREDLYEGTADWEMIQRVKEAVSIPVVGNGDITTPQMAKARMEETGVNGIMIGRGILGYPWLIADAETFIRGEEVPEHTMEDRRAIAKRHLEYLLEDVPARLAILEMRKHLAWYSRGFTGAAQFRIAANHAGSAEEVFALIETMGTEA